MTLKTPAQRFAAKWKLSPTGCHIWQGFLDKGGYGQFWDTKNHKAHRWALSTATGEWPDVKTLALHNCDTPACVNPDHLFWGTHQDNSTDMMEKGRHSPAGGRPPKLTPSQRDDIRAAYQPRKHAITELAKRYGVSRTAIYKIIHRQNPIDQNPPTKDGQK
jgi:hypothetical protein